MNVDHAPFIQPFLLLPDWLRATLHQKLFGVRLRSLSEFILFLFACVLRLSASTFTACWVVCLPVGCLLFVVCASSSVPEEFDYVLKTESKTQLKLLVRAS